jgi:hypothetical protein
MPARPPAATPGAQAFALTLAAAATRTVAAQQAAPAMGLGGLLAVQAMPDRAERKSAAVRRGRDLLADLDRLRIGLLSGSIDQTAVGALRARLKEARQGTDDPALDELLAHVELRAEVELAKLGR